MSTQQSWIRTSLTTALVMVLWWASIGETISAYALIDLAPEGVTSSSVEMEEGEELRVSREDLEQYDPELTPAVDFRAVLTNGDLHAYALTALRRDEGLKEMSFTPQEVSVSHRSGGQFLALVPVNFEVRVVAKAGGDVQVEFPWYSFLTITNREEFELTMRNTVENTRLAMLVGSVKAEGDSENPRFTAAESAAVAAKIHSLLEGYVASQEPGSVEETN